MAKKTCLKTKDGSEYVFNRDLQLENVTAPLKSVMEARPDLKPKLLGNNTEEYNL